MPDVYTSAVAEQRRERARAFLAQTAVSEPALVVVAQREAGMGLLRERVAGSGQAIFGWECLTLSAVAHRAALPALARSGRAPAATLARSALCTRVVTELAGRGQLGRFAAVAAQPGFPAALSQTLQELDLEGVSDAQLSAVDPDLCEIRRAYHSALDGAGLVDLAHVCTLAAEALAAGTSPWPRGVAVLALDPELQHQRQGALLEALLSQRERALCLLPHGDTRAVELLQHAGLSVQSDAPDEGLFDNALQRLQRHLFEEQAQKGDDDPAVTILSAPGEARECVELSRQVLWAAEDGIAFDRIAVLPRRGSSYHSYLSEAFRRAGIPAHFTHQARRPDPAGRALLCLLGCRAEGLSAERFAEYLSLQVVPRTDTRAGRDAEAFVAPDTGWERGLGAVDDRADLDEQDLEPDGQMPPDEHAVTASADMSVVGGGLRRPSRWERVLVEAAVIGGLDRWSRRLSGLQHELELARAARIAEGEDAATQERQLADLASLREFALPLLAELAALPETATWGVWLTQLSALARRALRKPAHVLSVLAELSPMAELGPVGLTEVQRVLRGPLSELCEAPDSARAGKVFVGDAEEARGLAFDLVCVPGLSEKIFPEKLREDPLLLDGARRSLANADSKPAADVPRLITNRERAMRERLCLRLSVGAARSRLILSYPRIDLERVRPRVPSFYGLEVLRASEGRLPGYDELMARAERSADVRIGWPAPSRARDAIDAAEHDLSVLERPLLRGQGAAMGAARYLLEVNTHLARALRFRARRWELAKFSPADGLVDPQPEALAALQAHLPDRRPYSATALQSYATCPYQFYLRAVLGLRPLERPESIEQLDSRQRGALFHAIQCALLSQLRSADALPVTTANLAHGLARLDAVIEQVGARYHEQLAPAIERVWLDGIADLRSDLRQWLGKLASQPEWRPVYFELGFGLPDDGERDPESRRAPATLASGIVLRGAIDLVEQRMGYLRATDHKTGRATAPSELRIGGGKALQPGLYAEALKALFPEREVDSGRLYYCTSRGGFEERAVPLDDELSAALKRFADTLSEALREGFLPAAPEDGACEQCDYRGVCGPYENQRLRRKRKERLQPLAQLRREA